MSRKKLRNLITVIATVVALFITVAPKLGLPISWDSLFSFSQSVKTLNSPESIHFIDVGEGDCTLIFAGDKTVMIDTATDDRYEDIDEYLKSYGVKSLDYLVITHPHADHMGGAPELLENYDVENLIMRQLSPEDNVKETYDDIISKADRCGTEVTFLSDDTVMNIGSGTFDFYLPVEEPDDYNEGSIVTLITFGRYRTIIMADAGFEAEEILLEDGYDISADIIRIGHHGSKYSSSSDFLNAVSAKEAVISVGENNYGHPTAQALSRIEEADMTWYRTDYNDGVYVDFYSDRYELQTHKGGRS